jgi:hypothetical protein
MLTVSSQLIIAGQPLGCHFQFGMVLCRLWRNLGEAVER